MAKPYQRPWNPPPGAVIFAALPKDEQGRTVWQCSACGKKGTWGPGWCGWGSLLDEDDGFWQAVVCSDACRDNLEPHFKMLLADVES